MQSPCQYCEKQGCGKAHDTCPDYLDFIKERAQANAERNKEAETVNAVLTAHRRRRKGGRR